MESLVREIVVEGKGKKAREEGQDGDREKEGTEEERREDFQGCVGVAVIGFVSLGEWSRHCDRVLEVGVTRINCRISESFQGRTNLM